MKAREQAGAIIRRRTMEVLLKRAGPYLFLEMVMPGGTLLALLLYFWRHRAARAG